MAVISRSGGGEGQGRFDHGSGGLPSPEAKQLPHNHHARDTYGACLVTMQRNHARRAEMTFHSPGTISVGIRLRGTDDILRPIKTPIG